VPAASLASGLRRHRYGSFRRPGCPSQTRCCAVPQPATCRIPAQSIRAIPSQGKTGGSGLLLVLPDLRRVPIGRGVVRVDAHLSESLQKRYSPSTKVPTRNRGRVRIQPDVHVSPKPCGCCSGLPCNSQKGLAPEGPDGVDSLMIIPGGSIIRHLHSALPFISTDKGIGKESTLRFFTGSILAHSALTCSSVLERSLPCKSHPHGF
jgi:hypothetical protein